MSISSNLLKINTIEFHVLGVGSENLETACRIGDTDVNFTVEPAKTAEGGVDGIWSVGSCHDNDV